jgi:hypothetical protein
MTAVTFVGYFTPIRELIPELFPPLQAGGWAILGGFLYRGHLRQRRLPA